MYVSIYIYIDLSPCLSRATNAWVLSRSSCTKFVSESWLLEPFIQQSCLSGLLIFICTSYATQVVCFTVSDYLVCLSLPTLLHPRYICPNLASSIAAAGSQVAHQYLTHQILSVALVQNINQMHLLQTQSFIFPHLAKKKMQIVATLRPNVLRCMC